MRKFLLLMTALLSFATAQADEIAPAGDADMSQFESLLQQTIQKSGDGADPGSFGRAISEEARALTQELAGKGNPVSEAAKLGAKTTGRDQGHGKRRDEALKENKVDRLKNEKQPKPRK